jgi:hypothetical protein
MGHLLSSHDTFSTINSSFISHTSDLIGVRLKPRAHHQFGVPASKKTCS